MALNQKFAQIIDAWAPSYGANTGALPASKWLDMTSRTRHQTSIRRGRQYETDQIQAGELSTTWDNSDGALDPLNASGPWFGNIRPYQPIKRAAQWSPTTNLLPQAIATGGDGWPTGALASQWGVSSDVDPAPTTVVLGAGVAFEETNAFQFNVPSTAAGFSKVFAFDAGPVTPGQQYAFSVYLRNVTASTALTGFAQIAWSTNAAGTTSSFSTSGSVTLTGSTSATWTRVTVSGAAPATCFGATLTFALPSTWQNNACTIQADGLQLEKNSTATTWVYPGRWYPQFAGFVERWPSQYADMGSRGEVTVTAVESFALLSQTTLADAFAEEVGYHNPRFYFPLSDAAGSTVFADQTGTFPPLPVSKAKSGAGSLTSGNSITASNLTTGVYVGSAGTVANITNSNPGTATSTGGASFLQLDKVGIAGMASQTSTRMFAVRYTGPTPTTYATIWSQQSKLGWWLDVQVDPTGYLNVTGTVGPDGNHFVTFGGAQLTDGNWHLIHCVGYPFDHVNEIPGGYTFYVDGVNVGDFGGVGQITADYDVYGCQADMNNGGVASQNYKGDISCIAEFSTALTSTDVANLYTAWRNACAGEDTGSRYARIVRYSGFTGNTWIDTGKTASMGPADFAGTDVVSALQAVVDTESGVHYVRQTGTIRFMNRAARYNALTPTLTFGEGTGEIPYEDLQLDYDSTHLANIVQVTQTSTGQVFTAQDATSIANYFPRIMTRSVNTTNALECQDCANYLLSRYKDPKVRITALKVNLSGNPSAWGSILPLELGDRIRVMRRPAGAPVMQLDCFVEQIQWDFDSENGAFLTLQCSPADVTPYGLFAAWHTTLGAATSVGDSSITVNATADNVNPLAAQIGVGQQIVVGQGGPVPETMTVKAVGATSPGWSTGVITFTSTMAHSHTNGFAVGEPLPGSVTDPTTYDAAAKFDATNFAY